MCATRSATDGSIVDYIPVKYGWMRAMDIEDMVGIYFAVGIFNFIQRAREKVSASIACTYVIGN